MPSRILLAAVLTAMPIATAYAGDVLGEWLRDDGPGKVRFSQCSDAVCGFITAKNGPDDHGKIGQEVFFDMKPDGDSAWRGTAFNPEDGKEYSGKMSLAGAKLTTAGCVFGGLICKSLTWSRTK